MLQYQHEKHRVYRGSNFLKRTATHSHATAAHLDEHLLDLHVVDHAAVPPGTLAEAALALPGAAHAHAAGEQAGAVGQQLDVLEVAGVEGIGGVLVLSRQALVNAPLCRNPRSKGMMMWSESGLKR